MGLQLLLEKDFTKEIDSFLIDFESVSMSNLGILPLGEVTVPFDFDGERFM